MAEGTSFPALAENRGFETATLLARGRSRRLDVLRSRWAHGFTVGCLLLWVASSFVLPRYLIAGPVPVLLRVARLFTDPFDRASLLVSLVHVVASLVLAFAIGGAMAFGAYYLPVARLMIQGRWYPFLNSFSGIGWAILAVLWFGPSHTTVLFAMTTVMVPFVFINLNEGLNALDAELLEMAYSLTRRRLQVFRRVVLPALYPFLFAALRIAFGVAWKTMLLAELFGTNQGVGFVVNQARQAFDSTTVLAAILLIVLVVFVTDRFLFAPIQQRLTQHYADV